jgi:hypothetical protein
MDKDILVGHINRLISEFGKSQRHVVNAGIVKAYPDLASSSYILALACPWMAKYESCYAKTEEVIQMMYNVFPVEAIKNIFAVNVFDNSEEVDIFFKNECRMEDASCFQVIQPIQEEMELAHA